MKAHTRSGAKVYTDEARAYDGLENRESVKHSVAEYVRGMAHTNGNTAGLACAAARASGAERADAKPAPLWRRLR